MLSNVHLIFGHVGGVEQALPGDVAGPEQSRNPHLFADRGLAGVADAALGLGEDDDGELPDTRR